MCALFKWSTPVKIRFNWPVGVYQKHSKAIRQRLHVHCVRRSADRIRVENGWGIHAEDSLETVSALALSLAWNSTEIEAWRDGLNMVAVWCVLLSSSSRCCCCWGCFVVCSFVCLLPPWSTHGTVAVGASSHYGWSKEFVLGQKCAGEWIERSMLKCCLCLLSTKWCRDVIFLQTCRFSS